MKPVASDISGMNTVAAILRPAICKQGEKPLQPNPGNSQQMWLSVSPSPCSLPKCGERNKNYSRQKRSPSNQFPVNSQQMGLSVSPGHCFPKSGKRNKNYSRVLTPRLINRRNINTP
ncbi:hypothetical protein CEXT_298491 [Caerostris extrusa]|uniref:Uncharacterized protein n=1 Tax=Caerostris extrusa TaxID=172846 RepID=A0AAV4Q785_CAEEX|nr:hypothetical protein CEXT_298491 [Caerostris extrusa]